MKRRYPDSRNSSRDPSARRSRFYPNFCCRASMRYGDKDQKSGWQAPHAQDLSGATSAVASDSFSALCCDAEVQFRAILMLGRYLRMSMSASTKLMKSSFVEAECKLLVSSNGMCCAMPLGPRLTAALAVCANSDPAGGPLFPTYYGKRADVLAQMFTACVRAKRCQPKGANTARRELRFSDLYFHFEGNARWQPQASADLLRLQY